MGFGMIPKCGEKFKLCYMETDSFIDHVKIEDTYKDIGEDVEARYGTLNYELKDHYLKERVGQLLV